jgi:hypothetical protein
MGANCRGDRGPLGEDFQSMNSKLITPGEPAPDIELPDVNGQLVNLFSYRGSQPVLLAFLRGFM